MESTNLGHHHHQHHEQLLGSSSIPCPSSSHGVGNNHAWHQNLLFNGGNYNPSVHGVLSSSRTISQSHEVQVPNLNTSMVQQLGFQLGSCAESYTNHLAHDPHLAKLEELPGYSSQFSGTISDTNNLKGFHLPSKTYIKYEQQELQDLNEKHLLNSFSSGCQMNGFQLTDGELYSNVQNSGSFEGVSTFGRGNLGQFLPRVNIQTTQNSLDMNLEALDLLASAKFGGSFGQASLNNLDLFREGATFGIDHGQEQSLSPSNSPQNIPSFMNGVAGTKRFNSVLEPKASQVALKKPRSDSPRSSFSPFKVRKEKLGDRIAALQQLVAPFGKTDTASVLTEAIGYIKFLQDQVETLSVPYMKSSDSLELQGDSSDESEKGHMQDLRSRGLCLVPLSCTSYVANFSGGVWSPPNFSGGT